MTENHIDADPAAQTTAEIPAQPAERIPAANTAVAAPVAGYVTVSKRALGIVAGVLVGFVLLGGVFASGVAVGGHMGGRPGVGGRDEILAQQQFGAGFRDGQGDERGPGGVGGRGMMRGQQGQGQQYSGQQGTPPGAPGALGAPGAPGTPGTPGAPVAPGTVPSPDINR